MKLILDERVKHRLTGVLVLLSLAVIFLPAMIKKSTRHLDGHLNVAIQVPSKPLVPKVVVPSEKAVFDAVKVPHVQRALPLPQPLHSQVTQVPVKLIQPAIRVVPLVVAKPAQSAKPAVPVVRIEKKALPLTGYGVQLASFARQRNANLLVQRLRSKGYQASYNTIKTAHGVVYKVVVGGFKGRDEARSIQKKLASDLQLNGFIILNEVG